MIHHKAISDRLGVPPSDADLLLDGRATARVAAVLNVKVTDIEEFIGGKGGYIPLNIIGRLDLSPPSAADELAKALGRDGRIGLLIGLMLESRLLT